MELLWLWLWIQYHLLSLYSSISRFIHSDVITTYPIFLFIETIISLYFRSCHLSPYTLDLDHQTTMHFWTTHHRRFHKPNLVIIHGYGGDSRWQFFRQVRRLSQNFNLYIPDLLFFGESYTRRGERSEEFQADCVCQGLKRLGVERFSVYAMSYGGYVGYRMAEIHPDMVEKVVIVSSGIGATEEQIKEQVKKVGRNAVDLLSPEKPRDLRRLMNLSIYKFDPILWAPNFFLKDFIKVTCKNYRKEKQELVEHLMANKLNINLFPVLTQVIKGIKGKCDESSFYPISLDIIFRL